MNLPKDKINATQHCFVNHTELMLNKGVYPYDYMDSSNRLEEAQLNPEAFFNKLSNKFLAHKTGDAFPSGETDTTTVL